MRRLFSLMGVGSLPAFAMSRAARLLTGTPLRRDVNNATSAGVM
jgi:hypothetical protein